MIKTFELSFNKYIKDLEFDKLPEYKGIYLFKVTTIKDGINYSTIIYIGKADGENGLKGRVNENHEHITDARKRVEDAKKNDKTAFLTIAYSDENSENEAYLERIEAALIFSKKPPINTQSKESFSYADTILNISGNRMAGLEKHYSVKNTNH